MRIQAIMIDCMHPIQKTLINAPVSGKRHQTTKAVSRTGTALFGKDESRMFSPDSVSIRLAL